MSVSLQATDRCVMCGLCLPHCPTYVKTRNEADSPRGRISLIQALDRGHLPVTPAMEQHLEGCLGCRACETVCPADVPYGELIDGAHTVLRQDRNNGLSRRLADALVTRRGLRRLAGGLLKTYTQSGLQRLIRAMDLLRVFGLARPESMLPAITARPVTHGGAHDDSDASRPQVALFTGCAAELFDRPTLHAARRLLEHLGYRVAIPRRQTCCGALDQHGGQPERAKALAWQNAEAFENIAHVITTASGCGAQLHDWQHSSDAALRGLAERHSDIHTFLAGQSWPAVSRFKPLAARVAVHIPCSLQYVLKETQAVFDLLQHIPDVELIELADNGRCCGAAGSYMLRQPAMADDLLNDKLDALDACGADLLVTANIGCALHLAAGLSRRKRPIEVLHPVTLLARQLAHQTR